MYVCALSIHSESSQTMLLPPVYPPTDSRRVVSTSASLTMGGNALTPAAIPTPAPSATGTPCVITTLARGTLRGHGTIAEDVGQYEPTGHGVAVPFPWHRMPGPHGSAAAGVGQYESAGQAPCTVDPAGQYTPTLSQAATADAFGQ